jgi:hypothetical protein
MDPDSSQIFSQEIATEPYVERNKGSSLPQGEYKKTEEKCKKLVVPYNPLS